MPEKMTSLYGSSLWGKLTSAQQIELGRLEMVQVMYSYAWSETLACLFFNKHLLSLQPDSVEYRFLIRELIEEFRHQEMFGMAIEKLDRNPIQPKGWYNRFAKFVIRFGSPSMVFMAVLSIELMADIYAKNIRQDEKVYSVLRKTSELHHIEEGRHIFYTKMWLEKFTKKAGFLRSTMYSLVVLFTIQFVKSLYIQKSFFSSIGVTDSKKYYKEAVKNYNINFVDFAMKDTIQFVKSINGFNVVTKPFWKIFLKIVP